MKLKTDFAVLTIRNFMEKFKILYILFFDVLRQHFSFKVNMNIMLNPFNKSLTKFSIMFNSAVTGQAISPLSGLENVAFIFKSSASVFLFPTEIINIYEISDITLCRNRINFKRYQIVHYS